MKLAKLKYNSTKEVKFHNLILRVPSWTYAVSLGNADQAGLSNIHVWGAKPTWDSEYSCYSYKHCAHEVIGTCKAPEWAAKDSLVIYK